MTVGNRVLAHELDAAWIIALWKYIHGGDPPPPDQVIAAHIIAALAGHVAGEAAPPPALEVLQQRFASIGSQITVELAEAPRTAAAALGPGGLPWQFVQVCFGVPPNRHCVLVQVPRRVAD